MKVMSWLMSKAKRMALSNIRYTMYGICLRLWGWGGDSVRCWVGVCHRDTETLLISSTCPYSLYYGSTTPGFEVFCIQQEQFNVTSNALFCILQVWQDFILNVVLRLLSRSTIFHSSKHIRTDSSIWDPLNCINARTCCLFLFSFINFQVEKHYQFS